MPDLDAVLARLGAAVVSGARLTEWGRRAVVRDPDGRRVELVEGGLVAGWARGDDRRADLIE